MGCCISPNHIIERNKKNISNKDINIEYLENKEFTNFISKKETKLTKEKNSMNEIIKNSYNEYEFPLNELNESEMSNNNLINKKEENNNTEKLETIKEVYNEISFRKIENLNNSFNKFNTQLSDNTEKIDSIKCEDNYTKKTNEMIKFLSRKK